MITQLTEDERLEFEAHKYSLWIASVLVLTSGRAVVWQDSFDIVGVFDIYDAVEALAFRDCLCSIASRDPEPYHPPRARIESPKTSLFSDQEFDAMLGELKI